MSNEYYDHGTFPTPNTKISSAGMRAELDNIETGFNKLPVLAGNQNKVVRVKADASGLEAVPAGDVVPPAPVASVAGKTGAVVLAKADVGLGNVDNTSDADKPVSTATQTALNSKSNTGHGHAISDVTGLQTALDGKQAQLVSGTNIKTINGGSMLGSGDISVTGVPAGCVAHFAVSSAPTGWLKANGALVSRTTYAALFAAIGTTFGAGDGSTTFALPDLRGEFIRGLDDGRGVDTGRALGSAQLDAMQGHKHMQRGDRTQSYWAGVDNATLAQGDVRESLVKTGSPVSDGTNGTPRTAGETRSRNVAMLACIKF